MPKKASGAKAAKTKEAEKAKVPKMSKAANLQSCPACGSDSVIYRKQEDELYCQDCGEVFAELVPDEESDYEKASDIL